MINCIIILYNLFFLFNSQSVDIYFGALNIGNVSEEGQVRLTVAPQHILVHEDFNSTGFDNDDIAMIKLPLRLIFNDYIQPAKLPVANNNYTGENILASGWGLVNGMFHISFYICTRKMTNFYFYLKLLSRITNM